MVSGVSNQPPAELSPQRRRNYNSFQSRRSAPAVTLSQSSDELNSEEKYLTISSLHITELRTGTKITINNNWILAAIV